MPVREQIRSKAYIYLDEVSPDVDTINVAAFPLEELLDEAGAWVVRTCPLHCLGSGVEMPQNALRKFADGSGKMPLPHDFVRLLAFKVAGWEHKVTQPIRDTDDRYKQQANRYLRGNESKPVVVLCDGDKALEYYSSTDGEMAEIETARYFPYTVINNNYPLSLYDVTSWKLAELIFAVSNDVAGMQVCQNKIQELYAAL